MVCHWIFHTSITRQIRAGCVGRIRGPGWHRTVTFLGLAGAFALQTMAVTPASKTSDDPAGVAFFETHVRPLLAERCYECHSGRAARLKAGLRVDHREFLLRGGDSGPAIVPGDVEASLLWKAVSGADEKLRMPPRNPLSAVEVDTLRRWIELGAPYPAGEIGRAHV